MQRIGVMYQIDSPGVTIPVHRGKDGLVAVGPQMKDVFASFDDFMESLDVDFDYRDDGADQRTMQEIIDDVPPGRYFNTDRHQLWEEGDLWLALAWAGYQRITFSDAVKNGNGESLARKVVAAKEGKWYTAIYE